MQQIPHLMNTYFHFIPCKCMHGSPLEINELYLTKTLLFIQNQTLEQCLMCTPKFLHQSTPSPTVKRLTLQELISCAYENGEEGKLRVSEKSYKAQARNL